MESNKKLELINLAIQKLIEDKRNKDGSGQSIVEDDDDHLLLSRLLSQLESLEGDDVPKQSEASTELEEVTSPAVGKADAESENAGQVDSDSAKVSTEEIVKELKKVKRQNAITHWLLSVMIILTVAWQIAEVSLLLKVKNGLSHPFSSFGSMLTGILKRPGKNGQDAEKQSSSTKEHDSEGSSLPLKLPELPNVELLDLGSNGEQH